MSESAQKILASVSALFCATTWAMAASYAAMRDGCVVCS